MINACAHPAGNRLSLKSNRKGDGLRWPNWKSKVILQKCKSFRAEPWASELFTKSFRKICHIFWPLFPIFWADTNRYRYNAMWKPSAEQQFGEKLAQTFIKRAKQNFSIPEKHAVKTERGKNYLRFVDNKIPFMAKSFTQQTFCVLLGSWVLLLHKYSPRFGLISHLVCQPKTLTSLSKCIQFSLIASAQPSQGISIASPTWRNFFFFLAFCSLGVL